MIKKIVLSIFLFISATGLTHANEKLTIVLDWYLNPDHAPLIVAQQIDSFAKHGLDVELVTPSDPNIGPRLVASGQADIALTYQQQLYIFMDEDLPLIRIGTLIETPLNTLLALPDSGIKSPGDLKGKKVGYSVSSIEPVILGTMLENKGLAISDVELVNVNFNLVSGLLSKQVDAVIGGYRNVEGNEIREQGIEPVVMKVEDYGVPPYDELIFVARNDLKKSQTYKSFLLAVQEGQQYLKNHPDETWNNFAQTHKELNTDLNKKIWLETVSLFSNNPHHLNTEKYTSYGTYLYNKGVIKKDYPLQSYATELK
ncbi:ABC transporter substrate-binding protein [uncultured Bartonella sp.]|uniref:ABC transporter substrate-binding protein n=1 Tax=uncultured Bartonella sp. TaxID=104108 RepID=UPI00260FA5F9|nr:ABC transporter substrate-binding protein [uncultured Bartonella sp.]